MDNLLAEIEKSKTVPLDRFIYALGIHEVGENVAKALAHQFCSIVGSLRNQSVKDQSDS